MKESVNNLWFSELDPPSKVYQMGWLCQLADSVETIASFGCWSHEPFILLWTLDASDVWVTERESRYVLRLRDDLERLLKTVPSGFKGRCVKTITADMITVNLPQNYFDMAFCERVLCNLSSESDFDFYQIQTGISKMVQITKNNGWIIAVESPLVQSDQYEKITRELFEAEGLIRYDIDRSPEGTFSYKKPM